MDNELKKEKPKRFRQLFRSQVINLLPFSEREKMTAGQLKRWVLDHSCDNCFEPFKLAISKEFHECRFNRDEIKRIPMVDINSSKFRYRQKEEAILSDDHLSATDSESDISDTEKKMKKDIKDSDSDLSFGSGDESDESDKICRSCKEEFNKAVVTKVKDDGRDDLILPNETYMLKNFSFFCEFNHLCRMDTNLIGEGAEVYFSGEATRHDLIINFKKAGPIKSWYLQPLDGKWWFCIGAEYAHFILETPSQEYRNIMNISNQKLKLFSIASEFFGLMEEGEKKDNFTSFVDFIKNEWTKDKKDESDLEDSSQAQIKKEESIEKIIKQNSSFLSKHLRETTECYTKIKFIETNISSSLKKKVSKKRKRGRPSDKKSANLNTSTSTVDLNTTSSSIQSLDFNPDTDMSDSDVEIIGEKEKGESEEEFNIDDEIQILDSFTISKTEGEFSNLLTLKQQDSDSSQEEEMETVVGNKEEDILDTASSSGISQVHDVEINDTEQADVNVEEDDVVEEVEESIGSDDNPNEDEMSNNDDENDNYTRDSSDIEILENEAEESESDIEILD